MDNIKITLIWGIIVFIGVFIINYLLFFKRNKKKIKKLSNSIGFSYIIPKFKLDIKKMNLEYVFILISLINSFIISSVFIITYIIPWNIGFKMLLGFVLLFSLIYALYEILGRHLVKKGWKK